MGTETVRGIETSCCAVDGVVLIIDYHTEHVLLLYIIGITHPAPADGLPIRHTASSILG
jgi:hypothetical protein